MVFEKEESYRIQLVRALGIIAVIGIHTCGGVKSIRPFINYAVAIFVFLSGYLTTYDLGGRTYSQFVWKRLSRILPPYVLWSLFFTAVNGTWKSFPVNLLTGRCEGLYYFVFVYVQLVILAPLVLKLVKSKYCWIGLFVAPISIVAFYYCLGNVMELTFPLSGELFVFWFTYYFLGLYIRNRSECMVKYGNRQLVVFYAASLAFQYAEGFIWDSLGNETLSITQMRISSFTSSVLFLILAYRFIKTGGAGLNGKWCHVLKRIGDYSFGIYLIHMAVIRAMMKFGMYDYVAFPINWVAVLLITALFILVVEKMVGEKISRILVGT